MKSFQQFITEVYDKDLMGRSQITKQGEGGRIGSKRKKEIADQPSPLSVQKNISLNKPTPKARVKAVGGGKTAPAKSYKDRKGIGTQRPRSTREQQPTGERGSAREKQLAAAKAERKRAAQQRAASKSGVSNNKKDLEKKATELLKKKNTQKTDTNNPKYKPHPDYKPQKASGLTQRERLNKVKKGEKALRDMRLQATGKTKESQLKHAVTQKEVSRRKKKAQAQ